MLRSEAYAETVATAHVSTPLSFRGPATKIFLAIALYDADKVAHEEAIRNGGVSPSFDQIRLANNPSAHHVLVRSSRS